MTQIKVKGKVTINYKGVRKKEYRKCKVWKGKKKNIRKNLLNYSQMIKIV
jgi:hypothetical protein